MGQRFGRLGGEARPVVTARVTWGQVKAMRGAGVSVAEIAAHFGVSRARVYQILKQSDGGKTQPHLTAEQIEGIRIMREAGATLREIGARYGFTIGRIYSMLQRKAPATLELFREWVADERARQTSTVRDLREAGMTYQQIAERVGVSRQRVHQILKREAGTEA